MSTAELACSYAAMILQDDGVSITAEKIGALVKSANVSVESCWPGLFAKLAEKRNLEDLFLNACATGGSPPVAVPPSAAGAGGATSAAVPAVEEKKEEAEEERDDEMVFSLFD
ncbi:large ribosomal subunit protein P1-like [Pyrus communis]|uniref:large ribosomal subunit protein P1-like n=1 Tax=Pyrus communis TaxID=23211 RepID=UPI0035BF9312